ncbi:hypothetical protein O6H91_Y241900 [Diphasiastrum complanatum]|nr:hypothetical protein O6H91_Y241900 [Diphasiastrum complanatum]
MCLIYMRHVNRLYLGGLSQRQNLDSVNLLLRFLKRTILVLTESFVSVPFMLYFRTLTLVMTFSHTNEAQASLLALSMSLLDNLYLFLFKELDVGIFLFSPCLEDSGRVSSTTLLPFGRTMSS